MYAGVVRHKRQNVHLKLDISSQSAHRYNLLDLAMQFAIGFHVHCPHCPMYNIHQVEMNKWAGL